MTFTLIFLVFHKQSYTLDMMHLWDLKCLEKLLRISYSSLLNLPQQHMVRM